MKKRIITIIGVRPQFIKAASLSRVLKHHQFIEEILVHTGQHFDQNMSDVFFDELKIPKPKYFLNVHGSTHGQMTGRMIMSIDNVLIKEKPSAVLIYGDTNSTLAGALAASKLHIPVMHVEAGLRSFNRLMPEEINRIITDHISQLLFCPSATAVSNLAKEGIVDGVHDTGDILYDAIVFSMNSIKERPELANTFKEIPNPFALLTVHREESTQSVNHFERILDYVIQFSIQNKINIIFPVHPRIKSLIKRLRHKLINIHLISPLSYFETQCLLAKAHTVLTDSGGLQKEAYFHRVPCITLRTETEWTETIETGWNKLWTDKYYRDRKNSISRNDGAASDKILKVMEGFL